MKIITYSTRKGFIVPRNLTYLLGYRPDNPVLHTLLSLLAHKSPQNDPIPQRTCYLPKHCCTHLTESIQPMVNE
jgi:hypothetical protein